MSTTPKVQDTFVLDVVNALGTPFRAVVFLPGAPRPNPARAEAEHAHVEFYDRRYPHTEHGQYVSYYRVRSLLDEPVRGGLNLHGGEPAWTIDADTWRLVEAWLRSLPLDDHQPTTTSLVDPRDGLLMRALPFLERLGDFIGNGPANPDRPNSLGARCDLMLDIRQTLRGGTT